jgi:hypothetical protein
LEKCPASIFKVRYDRGHRWRAVGRPWPRWEDNIRRDSLLLWNVREWRRLAEDRDIWRQTTEEARA